MRAMKASWTATIHGFSSLKHLLKPAVLIPSFQRDHRDALGARMERKKQHSRNHLPAFELGLAHERNG